MSNNSKRKFIFLSIFLIALISALIIGIDDNLPGILLLYLSSFFLIFSIVHHWRSKDRFIYLIIGSIFSLVIFGLLHNLFEFLAKQLDPGIISNSVNYLGILFFFITLFLTPPALIIGILGIIFVKSSE